MTRNHLPGGADLGRRAAAACSPRPRTTASASGSASRSSCDPVATKVATTPGRVHLGRAGSTAFWVDPVEQLTAHFYTQLIPSSTYPLRTELRQLVYAALMD